MSVDLIAKWKNKEGTCLMYNSVAEIFDSKEKEPFIFEGGIVIEDVTDTTLTVIVLSDVLSDNSTNTEFFRDFINYGYMHESTRNITVVRNGQNIPHQEIVLRKIVNGEKLVSVTRKGNSITCNFVTD